VLVVSLRRLTSVGADARGTSRHQEGLKRRVQFQDELVEVLQGHVKLRVVESAAGVGVARILWRRRRVQTYGLAHSQDMAGYDVGHVGHCRHTVGK